MAGIAELEEFAVLALDGKHLFRYLANTIIERVSAIRLTSDPVKDDVPNQ